MSLTELETEVTPADAEPTRVIQGRTPWQLAWARLRQDKVAIASAVVILLIILMAICAPLLTRWFGTDPTQTNTNTGLDADGLPIGPSTEHLLGTDQLGRDIFSRAVYGARVSLTVGLMATFFATIVGVTIGLLAGYFSGWADAVLSRVLEIVLSFPYLIVALVAAATIGPSMTMVIVVIASFSFAAMARIVRGQVIAIKAREFVEAARSLGASRLRIIVIDILPNLLAPVIVLATLLIPQAIVTESTLTFLGAGVDIRIPSWGGMLAESTQYYRVAWWYLFVPSGLLLLTTLVFNLLGDGVRDALDPRSERLLAKAGKPVKNRSSRRRTRSDSSSTATGK
ncbi:MAG TPA: ABC transporter permease [Streptosporangiaceae bacterium]|jgi:ABC-type dipeptide/oligopeptide/nickel transport system permease subunit|nr:ABC transporter permease [Streptosporangiaceae bacterium]